MAYSPQTLERRYVIADLARSLMAWVAKYAPPNELDRGGEEEVEHIARDIGIAASELRVLASKHSDAADLLYRRMAVLGLDPDELRRTEPVVLRDLQRLCSMCERRKRCVLEFGERPASAVWQEYCPNRLTLSGLVASQPEPDNLESLIAYVNAARTFGPESDAVSESDRHGTKH